MVSLDFCFLCAVLTAYIPGSMTKVSFDYDDLRAYDDFPEKIQEVTFINPDNTVTIKPLGVSSECFFHGVAPTHNYSRAVITMCDDDVYGFIDQGRDGIFITPLNEKHSYDYGRRKRSTARPHIIYRRSLDGGEFCPVEYDGESDPIITDHDDSFAEQATEDFVPPKYLEVLLILDVDFVSNRGADFETYAMALMHVASRRYAEPSLDVSLKFYIVEVIALSSDSATVYDNPLSISSNGEATLDNLITWNTQSFIPDGEEGHWDNAVIISGKDLLLSDGNTGLLGIASILGTCMIGHGSNVNEDTGLSAGLTIAHEIGHTFTLRHDEDGGCDSGYVMSTFASSTPNSFFWTSCSSANLKIFFRSRDSSCMDNKPRALEALPALVLPGQMNDLHEQCNLVYGEGACEGFEVNCQSLQCMVGENCVQSFRSTAEGTPCGENMICLGAQCVASDSVPEPVNGMWSDWTEWPCSRSCGCGVLVRQRLCNQPTPQWGGSPCEGEGIDNTLCNCNSCGNSPDDHRNEQCAASNNVPLNGVLYSWTALFGSFLRDIFYCQNPCQTTLPNGYLRPPFENVDGTDCWDHEISDWSTLQKCVGGLCQEFGCDGVQGSTKSFDSCRICNGDGSSCEENVGFFSSGELLAFNDVVTIPQGATSVVITNEDLINGNPISIFGLSSGTIYFFGSGSSPSNSIRSWYMTMTIIHEFNSDTETFFTQGPTIEALQVRIFLNAQVTNNVKYEYYEPVDFTSYFWNICDYEPCSLTCGGGMQSREITCDQIDGNTQMTVDDSMCTNAIGPKPGTTQSCNTEMCPSWIVSEFGVCSQTCETGMQSRDVECQFDGSTVADSLCEAEKPETTQPCNEFPCDLPEECCEHIRSSTGTVERQDDTGGRTCIITLIAPIGRTFELDNIDIDISCRSESINVRDGETCYPQCSPGFKSLTRAHLKGNIIVIEYSLTGSGSFRFDFKEKSDVTHCPSKCDQFIDTFSAPNQGVWSTPGFPRNYPPKSNCMVQIVAEKGKKLFLRFSRFLLQGTQRPDHRRHCLFDRVELTNLLTGSKEIICGRRGTFARTLDNYVQLHFTSNKRRNFRGFQVKYIVQ